MHGPLTVHAAILLAHQLWVVASLFSGEESHGAG